MFARWRENRKLRRARRNEPARGLTVVLNAEGRIVAQRALWLWQREWTLLSERVKLSVWEDVGTGARCVLYDKAGRLFATKAVEEVLCAGDSLDVEWTVEMNPWGES